MDNWYIVAYHNLAHAYLDFMLIYQASTKETSASPGYDLVNGQLDLSLVNSLLAKPDEKKVVKAPIMNPLPFQVYLIRARKSGIDNGELFFKLF